MYNSIFKLPTAQNRIPKTYHLIQKTQHLAPNTHFSIDDILNIAYKAGQKIMEIYSQDFDIEYKDDKSPLTLADKSSNKVIMENLRKYNLPILSEEEKEIQYDARKNWELFWMIDPLDGTKKFIDDTINTISTIKIIKTISKGSSLKLCMVAEGVADIYPRLAPTMEWDTSAADAVVRKFGKNTYKISSIDYRVLTNLEYNKENLLNPWFVVK